MRSSTARSAALFTTLVCAGALVTACGSSSADSTSDASGTTVTIALGGPFSGSEKPTGDQIIAGATLAAKQINDAGGITAGPRKGATIVFKQYDDADDPAKAATNMRTIVSNTSLAAFVGSGLSDASIAAAPVASRAGFPYLAAYASSEKILSAAKNDKSVFVVPPTFPAYAYSVANQMVADKIQRAAIIHLQGTYGDGIADLTSQHLKDAGVDVVSNQSFTFTDTDFRTQLGKIKAANPDALVMVGLADSDAAILKQAKSVKLDVPAYDPGGITNSSTFLTNAGALADGVTGNTPDSPSLDAKAATLQSDYKAATGEDVVPDPAAFAYEGVQAVAAAFADGATGSKDLADHLHKISITDTGVGPLSFAADGSRVGGRLFVFRVKDGAPSFVTGYEQTGPFAVKEIPLPN